MSTNIVAQSGDKVKCSLDECHEPAFRQGLCFDHFVEEETVLWDDQDAERQICLAGVGYIFSGEVIL